MGRVSLCVITFHLVIASAFFTFSSFAQETQTSRLQFETTPNTTKNSGTTDLGFEHGEYISSGTTVYRPGAKSNRDSLILNLSQQRQWRGFTFQMQAHDEFSQTENWNYFDVYQFYAQTPIAGSGASLIVGRKLYTWTEWEEPFRQGVFQPRYLENRLNPVVAGLTGAFVDLNQDHHAATIGVLPIFLPDFGTHSYVKDNLFYSANPWFHPPASQFEFNHQTSEIHHTLKSPDSMSVVNHPGVVGKYEYHEHGYLGRFSYAYKPIPQMLLLFPSTNRAQVSAAGEFMSIEVHARVLYHRVANLDQVVELGNWRLSASIANETPDHDLGPEDYTVQEILPTWIYSASISHPLETPGPHAANIKLGYFRVDGGDARDRGPFASSTTLFERRYQYLEAYLMELHKSWRGLPHWMPETFETGVRALFDPIQNGGVFSFTTAMNFNHDWRASVRADLLGLVGTKSQVDDGFLSTYRANDSLNVGLSYVF